MLNWAPPTRDGKLNWATLDRSSASVPPTITTQSLPDASLGVAYDFQLVATGDTPMTWARTGTLPSGLSMSPQGHITGIPTAPGKPSGTFTATNAVSSVSKTLTLHVPNEGVGGMLPVVTTVVLVPSSAQVKQGAAVLLQMTVEDESGEAIPNISGTATSGAAVIAEQLTVTNASGQAQVSAYGENVGTASVTMTVDGVVSNATTVTVIPAVFPLFVGSLRATVAAAGNLTTSTIRGVRIRLHDRFGIARVAKTGLRVMWWDGEPTGAPVYEGTTDQIDANGWVRVDLDAFTKLPIGGEGHVKVFSKSGSAQSDWHFSSRLVIQDVA